MGIKDLLNTEDDYDAFCAQHDVRDFRDKIIHWFGERCPEFEEGCYTCQAWKLYDKFVELMEPTTNPNWNPSSLAKPE